MAVLNLSIPFFLGLLSAFSPCLFPLLPSYVAVTLRSEASGWKIFLSSLSLISGVVLVFLVVGQLIDFIGSFLLKNYGLFSKIQGGLLILAGIIMIRPPSIIYEIQLPSSLQNKLYSGEEYSPVVFSFIVGILFTIIAAPCAAGYFLTVWTLMLGETFLSQFLIVLLFAIGVGLPFMLMSLFVPDLRSGVVSNVRKATSKITIILGVLLVIFGIWLILSTSPISITTIS